MQWPHKDIMHFHKSLLISGCNKHSISDKMIFFFGGGDCIWMKINDQVYFSVKIVLSICANVIIL